MPFDNFSSRARLYQHNRTQLEKHYAGCMLIGQFKASLTCGCLASLILKSPISTEKMLCDSLHYDRFFCNQTHTIFQICMCQLCRSACAQCLLHFELRSCSSTSYASSAHVLPPCAAVFRSSECVSETGK